MRDAYFSNLAKLGYQVADGLAYAHGKRVLHRDIKPANLLLDTQGVVWITDFGLAKINEDNLTRSGDIVGTIRYMAPERFRGQVDARSDIYSLGLCLYEFATLRPAFEVQQRASLIQQISDLDPVLPRKLDPRIPLDFETIILKCIDKEPSRRYATAGQLAEDLQLFLADKPITARRISWPERCWRWCRRNRAVSALAFSVLTLILAVAIISSVAAVRMAALAREVQREHRVSLRSLFDSYLDQAESRRLSQGQGQRMESLAALKNAADIYDQIDWNEVEATERRAQLRSDVMGSLSLLDLVETTSVEGHETLASVQYDFRFERYATADEDGTVELRRNVDNQLLHRWESPGLPAWELRFSPRGRYLAAKFHPSGEQNEFVRVWDTQTGTVVHHEEGAWAGFYAFSFDDRLFANCGGPGQIQIRSLAEPQTPAVQLSSEIRPTYLRFRPDGRQLAAASTRDTELEIWDLAQRTSQVHDAGGEVYALYWSEDSTRFAVGAGDGVVRVWHADQLDTEPQEMTGHTAPVVTVRFGESGNWLLSQSWDGSARFWDVPRGIELFRAHRMVSPNCNFADGNRIVYRKRDRFGIAKFGFAEEVVTMSSPVDAHPRQIVYHPQLPILLAANDEGIELWNAETHQRLAHADLGFTYSAIFSPDGRSIYTSGPDGVHRRSLRTEENTEGQFAARMGPPERVFSLDDVRRRWPEVVGPRAVVERISIDSAGRRLAVDCGHDLAVVLDLEDSSELKLLSNSKDSGHQKALNYAEISPCGRWVITTTWHGRGVWVWDAVAGTLVTKLLDCSSAIPAFSADGRWLGVTTYEQQVVWEVGSWQERLRFERESVDWPGCIQFSPDNRLLLTTYDRRAVQIREFQSGELLATLRCGNSQTLDRAVFSWDSAKILALSRGAYVEWDLHRIRQRLARLGLDWQSRGSLRDPDS